MRFIAIGLLGSAMFLLALLLTGNHSHTFETLAKVGFLAMNVMVIWMITFRR